MRAIPEWLDLAAAHDAALAAELWTVVDRFEREGMVHGTVESDARATLDQLAAAGLRLAVLTNNSLGSAEAALERFDLRAPLDLVLARDVVPALKPSGVGRRPGAPRAGRRPNGRGRRLVHRRAGRSARRRRTPASSPSAPT